MNDLYQHPEWQALFAAIAADPGDPAMQRIAADWLLERGESEAVAFEAILRRPLSVWDVWNFGIGIGSGSGIGSGRGRGSGIGIGSGRGSGIGSGSGSGSGRGRGSGIGSGSGSGRGSGIGSGIGSGSGSGSGRGSGIGSGIGSGSGSGSEFYRVKQMRIGGNYLVHCGDWHTFVGRVTAQIGPGTYEMEKVSKIRETNNFDCWHDLAAGNEQLRLACDYVHYRTTAVVPLTIAAFEWVGQLPQEQAT